MSRRPDNKSICSKYGFIINDPIVQRIKHGKSQNKGHKLLAKIHPRKSNGHKKGSYKIMPRTHYQEPKDIHLKSQRKNMITYWLCGQTGHTANRCPQGRESRENIGKKTQEYASRRCRIHFKEEVHLLEQNFVVHHNLLIRVYLNMNIGRIGECRTMQLHRY